MRIRLDARDTYSLRFLNRTAQYAHRIYAERLMDVFEEPLSNRQPTSTISRFGHAVPPRSAKRPGADAPVASAAAPHNHAMSLSQLREGDLIVIRIAGSAPPQQNGQPALYCCPRCKRNTPTKQMKWMNYEYVCSRCYGVLLAFYVL